MYIAIHVQTNRENWVMTRFRQVLETIDATQEIILHRLERTVVKLIGGKLKKVKENIFPSYLIAEIKGGFNDEIYRLLAGIGGLREKRSQGKHPPRLFGDRILIPQHFNCIQ